jgi:asparagine synthase (glutamine-hydrolysing)
VNAPSRPPGTETAAAYSAGHPRFLDPDLAAIAQAQGAACAWSACFARHGVDAPLRVAGDFAVVVSDASGRTLLAVDRFAICNLYYRVAGSRLLHAARGDELARESGLDPQALYHYLYFHVVPAPRTVFPGVLRVPAGHRVLWDRGHLSVSPWWTPVFEEDRREALPRLEEEFRATLREAVAERAAGGRIGCFLSGGTDSSTVAGMVGAVTGTRVSTFSIGFDAAGYDEMAYARIAARHFETDHHEYYVTPDDLAEAVPRLAAASDQPFGNSSLLPAYYCARMAREAGVDTMLAGDGGDELFGGNTRYARQRVLAAYEAIPRLVREGCLERGWLAHPAVAWLPGVRKAASYVEQARVPMPDRMEAYNLLARVGFSAILTPEFLAAVDPDRPLAEQRAVYAGVQASSLVNRMLAYDFKYTLADTDLPKVCLATCLAGVAPSFPLLDDRLVDFSLRLAPSLKVRGLTLRWFFKRALRDFLPAAVINKQKHGFGLPFGVWVMKHAKLRALALESLDLLRSAGIVQPRFLARLSTELLPEAPGYYGELVWILMMLGQWRAHARPLRTAASAQPDGRHAMS